MGGIWIAGKLYSVNSDTEVVLRALIRERDEALWKLRECENEMDCATLKRERDEARSERDLHKARHQSSLSRNAQLLRERDEARAELGRAYDDRDKAWADVTAICVQKDQALRERDEAREEIEMQAHSAFVARGERDDALRERDDARTALAQALQENKSLQIDLTEAEGNAHHWHGEWEIAIDEKNTLLAEGLALWNSERRLDIGQWFGFWQKVRAACPKENKCE